MEGRTVWGGATGSGTSEWNEVTSRLATLDPFNDSDFLRLSLVPARRLQPRWREAPLDWVRRVTKSKAAIRAEESLELRRGQLVVTNRQQIVLRCWFYRRQPLAQPRVMTLACDSAIVHISTDAQVELSSRYDEVEFWLHPQRLAVDSRTALTLRLPGDPGQTNDLGTRVSVPVLVRRPVGPRLLRGLVGATRLALVAAPALLEDSPTGLRIGLAVLGAALVSLLAAFSVSA